MLPGRTMADMAGSTQKPGSIVGDPAIVPIKVPAPPWSPWLRLAHLFRYVPDQTSGVLRRLKDWELVLQLEGESWVHWECMGTSEALAPGCLLLIPPGEAHVLGQVGEHLAVHFDWCAVPELLHPGMMVRCGGQRARCDGDAVSWRLHTDVGELAVIPAVRRPANGAQAIQDWRARLMPLVRQWLLRRHDEPLHRLEAMAVLATVLRDLVQVPVDPAAAAPAPGRTRARTEADLSSVLSLLDLDARRWSVAELARRAGMGETVFRATMRRLTGESPRAFLERHRFERAQQLLLTTTHPIAHIAALCGYDDPFHFSRVCRRRTGRSPRQWRQAADPGW